MRTKKIVIDSCEQCPLREHRIFPLVIGGKEVYDVCQHVFTYDMDITNAITLKVIHPDCSLEDNSSEEYEECEECGTIDEAVEYREEIDGLGRYLCNMCYVDGKVEMKADES